MWLYMSRLSTDSGSKPRESMNCLREPTRRVSSRDYDRITIFIGGEPKTGNNLDSLERFVLAVDLGHNVPQQFGLLLTGRAEKQDRR